MSEKVWFNISSVYGKKAILTQNADEAFELAHRIADESGVACLIESHALNIERTIYPKGQMDIVHRN
jgi:hypothetical protein